MTRTDNRELEKKSLRNNFFVVASISLIPFTLGFLTHYCVCQIIHNNEQSVVTSLETATVKPLLKSTEDSPIEVIDISEVIIDDENVVPIEEEVVFEEKEPESIEPIEEEFNSYYTYTEGELDLLSRLIHSEGGTESYETKLKIGSVVMNRVSDLDSEDFPDTIWEVIYQKGQFSVTTIKIDGVTMIDHPADEESLRAAREVLDYGSILPSDVQVFYAKDECHGNWVTSRAIYEVSDNTVFAYIYSK